MQQDLSMHYASVLTQIVSHCKLLLPYSFYSLYLLKLLHQALKLLLLYKSYFTQRIINAWNDLPTNIINFSSLVCFRRSLLNINFSDYLVVI